MLINHKTQKTNLGKAIAEIRENCLGCGDCKGACAALADMLLLPEIFTERRESRH